MRRLALAFLLCLAARPAVGATAVAAYSLRAKANAPVSMPIEWKELSKEYRCVLFDHRGHGRSGEAAGGDHTLQAMGRDMKAVIDAAVPDGRPVVVLGHSMGGMAILGLAETLPELFGDRIVGAVFADTAAAELVRGAAGAIGTRLIALAPGLEPALRNLPRQR